MNDLLSDYKGPVLVAQGRLDPLNDAVGRAALLSGVRAGVDSMLLSLGHCPMDEGPQQVAKCVKEWSDKHGLLT